MTTKNRITKIICTAHSEFAKAVAQDNQASVIKYLNWGVNPNIQIRPDHEKTALMFYAERGNLDIVKELLANGAGIHFQEKILINSMKSGYSTGLGYSALMFAAKHGHLDIVNELVSKGADVNLKNKKGYSAAMVAAEYKFPEIGIILIENGTNVVYIDDDEKGRSLLTVAIEHYAYCNRNSEKRTKFVEFIQRIVEKGADVNEIDRQEDLSPLMYASEDASLPIVEFLIENGANVNVTNKHGHDALYYTINYFHELGWETDLFIDGGYGYKTRCYDTEEWFRIFEILVDNSDNMYNVYRDRTTRFTFLSYLFHAEVAAIKYFDEDNDVPVRQDRTGMILLDLPIEERKKRVSKLVEKMIRKGVNVSVKDDKGRTAGDYALETIYKEIGDKLKRIEAAILDF